MEKVKKLFCMFLLPCLILCGCRKPFAGTVTVPSVVREISVSYQNGHTQLYRLYTNTAKMDVILYYLYGLTPYGHVEQDPEMLIGEQCRILVSLSDGSQHIYRQYGKQYLSIDNRPWQMVNKEKATVLFHLLNHIESDR